MGDFSLYFRWQAKLMHEWLSPVEPTVCLNLLTRFVGFPDGGGSGRLQAAGARAGGIATGPASGAGCPFALESAAVAPGRAWKLLQLVAPLPTCSPILEPRRDYTGPMVADSLCCPDDRRTRNKAGLLLRHGECQAGTKRANRANKYTCLRENRVYYVL